MKKKIIQTERLRVLCRGLKEERRKRDVWKNWWTIQENKKLTEEVEK